MYRFKIENLKEMEKFGEKLGKLLLAGDLLCLTGDLGVGKTTLTKSIGKGLGIKDYITSPTFSLVNEYKGREWVYHFDVYRLDGIEDIDDLGFDEYLYSGGINIIEWADKINEFLPKDRINLNIEKTEEDTNVRIIEIYGFDRAKDIIEELKK